MPRTLPCTATNGAFLQASSASFSSHRFDSNQLFDSSFALACNIVCNLWRFRGLQGFPNPHSFHACYVDLEPRPLPSIGITLFPRYYGPLRHPAAPRLALTGFRLIARTISLQGFPCCACLPLPYMPSPIPRRNHRLLFSFASPMATAFPVLSAGWLPQHPFRGLHSVHITLRPACSPSSLKNPLHQRLQTIRYLHACSGCYRSERKLPGGIRTR